MNKLINLYNNISVDHRSILAYLFGHKSKTTLLSQEIPQVLLPDITNTIPTTITDKLTLVNILLICDELS